MAIGRFGVNDANAVKAWQKRLESEALKETYFARFIGKGSSALAQEKTEQKAKGDQVTYSLRMLASGRGVGEGATLEGNEESLALYSDAMKLGYLRHGVRVPGDVSIDSQRILFDLRTEAKDTLRDWWAERLDTVFFNHLCGYTPANTATAAGVGPEYIGGNTILAPTTNRIVRPASITTDQGAGADATKKMTMNLMDQAVLKARTATPMLRPIKVGGENYYVVFLHEAQAYDLRADASTAGNWFDLQKARLQGGEGDANGIFTGGFGIYNGCVIHVSNRVTLGVHSSTGASVANCRRAVLCGQQALAVGFGENSAKNRFAWSEKYFDYDEELGIKAGLIFGMKKVQYSTTSGSNEDYGVITIPTYSTQ